MDAAQRRQQEEQCERSMVLVTTAVVDPGTVVVHLHDTSKKNTCMKHTAQTRVSFSSGFQNTKHIGMQYAQESWGLILIKQIHLYGLLKLHSDFFKILNSSQKSQ